MEDNNKKRKFYFSDQKNIYLFVSTDCKTLSPHCMVLYVDPTVNEIPFTTNTKYTFLTTALRQ